MKRIAILFICILLLFLTACQPQSPQGMDVLPEDYQENKEQTINYKKYEKAGYFYLSSLQIPSSWYMEETKDGFILLEQKTGTEIAFIIEDYAPTINNIDYATAKRLLTNDTTSFVEFQKPYGNQLIYKYKKLWSGKEYRVVEMQKFNFNFTYTIKFFSEAQFYDKYISIAEYVFNSMTLPTNVPTVEKGYYGIFHQATNVLTFYPANWKTTFSGNSYSASISNSSLSVTYNNSIKDFSQMDKNSYQGIMSQQIQNFSTSLFTNKDNQVTAEGYFTSNSVRYIVLNTIINTDNFSINIVFVAPENEVNTYGTAYIYSREHIYRQTLKEPPKDSTEETSPESTEGTAEKPTENNQ